MRSRLILATIAVVLLLGTTAAVAQSYDDVQYASVKAAENIYMLQGAGGNIGLFFGPDGAFLIDDQFAPLHEKLVAKIAELSGTLVSDPSRTFLINTHFHPDHTGGNELLGERGTITFAHENVRQRLTVEQVVPFFNTRHPALTSDGLPVITFSRDITFHLNGDSVRVFHVDAAHTDGDAIVNFTRANVIHAGDIVFMQTYPFIDLDNGGSVQGVIAAAQRILDLSDENTAIIPGHGHLTDRAGIEGYRVMLTTIYGRIQKMVAEGKSLGEIQTAKPTADFDDRWNGFITGEAFVGILHRDLARRGASN